jgi:putative flippase GtrA
MEKNISNVPVESLPSPQSMPKKDLWTGIILGFLIGLLAMPVLKTAQPEIYLKLKLAVFPIFLIGTPLGLVICHIISRKISVIWQLAKFSVTGVLNVLVDFTVLIVLIFLFRNYLNVNPSDILLGTGIIITFYSLFKAVSFIVANVNSYFWNKYWTFEETRDKKSGFLQFFIVSIIGFVVNVVIASLIFNVFSSVEKISSEQWALIGAAAGTVVGLIWNFLGYKFIVFKK